MGKHPRRPDPARCPRPPALGHRPQWHAVPPADGRGGHDRRRRVRHHRRQPQRGCTDRLLHAQWPDHGAAGADRQPDHPPSAGPADHEEHRCADVPAAGTRQPATAAGAHPSERRAGTAPGELQLRGADHSSAAGRQPAHRPRREGRHHRPQRFGQEHPGPPADGLLQPERGTDPVRRPRPTADRRRRPAPPDRLRRPRPAAACRHPAQQHDLGRTLHQRRAPARGRRTERRQRAGSPASARLRAPGRRARATALRRPAPGRAAGPRPAAQPATTAARRADQLDGQQQRGSTAQPPA
ncbi:hypothetical protein D3C78_1088510 [compost metagenome]